MKIEEMEELIALMKENVIPRLLSELERHTLYAARFSGYIYTPEDLRHLLTDDAGNHFNYVLNSIESQWIDCVKFCKCMTEETVRLANAPTDIEYAINLAKKTSFPITRKIITEKTT